MDAVSGPNRPEEGQDAAPSALDPLFSMLNDLAAKIQGNAAVTREQASGLLGQLQSMSTADVEVSTGLTPEQRLKNREIWKEIAQATPETFLTVDVHRMTYLSLDAARDLARLLKQIFDVHTPIDPQHWAHFKLSSLVDLDVDVARTLATVKGVGFTLDGLKEFTPGVAALINGMKSIGNENFVTLRSMRVDDTAARFLIRPSSERIIEIDQANFSEPTMLTVRLALINGATNLTMKVDTVTKEIAQEISATSHSNPLQLVFNWDSPPSVHNQEVARLLSGAKAQEINLMCPSDQTVASALVAPPTQIKKLNLRTDGTLPTDIAATLTEGAVSFVAFLVRDLSPELARVFANSRQKTIHLYGVEQFAITEEIDEIFSNGNSSISVAGRTYTPKTS